MAAHHATAEMSKRYLADNVERILSKSNPARDELLNNAKEF